MPMLTRRQLGLGLAATALAGRPGRAASVAVEAAIDHIAGQRISVLIPAAAGGGTDLNARRFMAQVQALSPSSRLRIENLEQAGGNLMASELWRARGDGLTIGFPANNLFYSSIIEPQGLNFRVQDFTFFGSLTRGHRSLVLSNRPGAPTLDEVLSGTRIVTCSANTAVSGHYYDALITNALTGSRILPVPGYSAGARNMAVISGEVDGQMGTIEGLWPIIEAEAGYYALRLTTTPLPDGYPEVPRLADHLRDPGLAWAISFLDAVASLGRPVAGPPDTDPVAAGHWRALFDHIVADPAYHAQAREQDGIIIEPSDAAQIDAQLLALRARGDTLSDDINDLLDCGHTLSAALDTSCAG